MARKPFARFKIAVFTFLGSWFIRLLFLTTRKEFVHRERELQARERSPHGNAIYAIWHGRIVLACCADRNTGIHAMISLHGDGELIARVARRLGFHAIRGSSSRGGARALKEALDLLQRGERLVITPDGPRGPRFHVHEGCLFAAQKSGVPLVPVGFSASRFWQFRSWDGTLIPKPFAKIRITIGEPLYIEPDATAEQMAAYKQALQDTLLAATKQGDAAICKTLPGYEQPPRKRRK